MVSVIFTNPTMVGQPDPTLLQSGQEDRLHDYENGPTLSPYILLAFATRHAAGASHLILAAVLLPGADPDAAASTLGGRLRSYRSLLTGAPLSGHWSFEKAVGVREGDFPVALVVMRVSDPTGSDAPAVFTWDRLILQRDTLFLTIGP